MNWQLVHQDKGGHRLFVDLDLPIADGEVPRLFAADNSGTTPDRTDDGPLEIPMVENVILAASLSGELVANMPVIRDGQDHGFRIGLSAGCALFVAKAYGVPLGVQDKHWPDDGILLIDGGEV